MEARRIQEWNTSDHYIMSIEELTRALYKNCNNLQDLEIKWSKEKGYEVCVLNFNTDHSK